MKELKSFLDNEYEFYKKQYASKDPVWILHKFKTKKDLEIAAFIISCFSYGQVEVFNSRIEKVFNSVGFKIYDFVSDFKRKTDIKYFKNFYYRFNDSIDLIILVENLKNVINQYKSLKYLFLKKYSNSDENILPALTHFSQSLKSFNPSTKKSFEYLIPDVSRNSTCKRLNLFLRWVVRKDEIDFGIWNDKISPSKLIIPVDTHVYRVSKKLKLIKRNSCDLKFAVELTIKLKEFDPFDPVKYDFALCHLGIDKRM